MASDVLAPSPAPPPDTASVGSPRSPSMTSLDRTVPNNSVMASDVPAPSPAPPPDTVSVGSSHSPSLNSLDQPDSVRTVALRPELLHVWPVKCAYVVEEILQTEHDYVNSLEEVMKGYQNPLAGRLQSTSEGRNFVATVFCNIEQLYEIHCLLYQKLKLSETIPHEFGQAFSNTAEDFKEYTKYCMNYDTSLQCLERWMATDKELKAFILECQRSLHHSLPLSAYLIKPVHRLMKYHLLLQQLLKHFNPDHHGYDSLINAQKSMVLVAEHINQVKKRHENTQKVQDIQRKLSGWTGKTAETNLSAYGELLHEGECKVGKRRAERHVLLFEKLLLILKKKDAKHYTYKGHILRDELAVSDASRSDSPTFKVFSLHHRHQSYAIHAKSKMKHEEWVGKIHQLTVDDELEQLVKRRKLDTSAQPEKELDEPRMRLASTKSKRIMQRKRKGRSDVRSFFSQEEGAPELKSYKAVNRDVLSSLPQLTSEETTTQVVEVAFSDAPGIVEDSGFEAPASPSKSMDSLLSLSDVEVGMEDTGHFGDLEEVDASHVEMSSYSPRKKSKLRRKTTIMVKRNRLRQAAQSSTASLLRAKARLARESMRDEPVEMADGNHSEEEDSKLLKLIGSKYDSHGESLQSDTGTDYSREQSVDGIFNGFMEKEEGSQQVPSANRSRHTSCSSIGPSIQIISDEFVDEGENIPELNAEEATDVSHGVRVVEEEEGKAGEEGEAEEEDEGDFVIMEDSSDSEDEEEEDDTLEDLGVSVDLGTSVDQESIPDTELQQQTSFIEGPFEPHETADQEVPVGGVSGPAGDQTLPLNASDERSVPPEGEVLGKSATPEPEVEHEQEDTLTEMETPERSEMDSHIFHFKGVTDIYGTVPRRHRHRGTPPAPKPPSTIAVSRRYGSSHTLSQDTQSRRAQRFSQLLEFTKQQGGFAPQPSRLQDITQSLPPSRPQLFSPQREVVVEEMENATASFPAVKPQEFLSQDVSSIDQQVQSVTDNIPVVPHIKTSRVTVDSAEVEDSELPAKEEVTKPEDEPMPVDSKEDLSSEIKAETIADVPHDGDVTVGQKEKLTYQDQTRASGTTTQTSDELRQRLPQQQTQPSVTEHHPTLVLNEDQGTSVEPSQGIFAVVRSHRRVGLLPTILRWGLVIVGIGVVAYIGYLGYNALQSSYSDAASSQPL